MTSWQPSFNKGVSCFRSGTYEDSLKHFNKSIELGATQFSVYDSRAAVYEKLQRYKDAMMDSYKVIELVPNQWQGYARCARLFLKLEKPVNALKMVHLALERVKENDSKRKGELDALKQHVLRASEILLRHKSRTTYHFGKLPVEIASQIFSFVLQNDQATVVTLSHVCQHWRRVTLDTPSFWSILVLNKQRPVKKAQLWKERSGGKIIELCLREGIDEHDEALSLEVAKLFTTHLRVLKTSVNITNMLDLHNPGIRNSVANLDELDLRGAHAFRTISQPNMQARILDFREASLPFMTIAMHFSLLETLLFNANSVESTSSLLAVLRHNPSIHTLCAVSKFAMPAHATDVDTDPMVETALRHLEVERASHVFLDMVSHVFMPSLQVLRLSTLWGNPNPAMIQLRNSYSSLSLTELSLRSIAVSPDVLRQFLEASPCLQILSVIGISDVLPNIEFLAEPTVSSESVSTPSLPCPLLRSLDFSFCNGITSGPVIRLVKARLAEGNHTQIESLMIDGCLLIEADVLPWLRSKVPKFSCVYMSKKQAAWKR